MDVFDLFAKLTLDTSEYEGGLNNARDSAEKGGSKIGAALGTAGKMAGAAIAAATTAAVGFGAASVATGADFDKSMSQVAATMGYTVEQLNDSTSEASQNFNQLRDFAQEMGSTTAFSATQAADALNYMALAGYDTETSIEMLPTVLDLAASGSMDLARASDMVTDTQSALGLSLEETSDMVDQMAKTASKSNTSVEQLGDAMLTIGATARNVAGGTTELSTVLGVLADNGIKGSEAGTHLRNILLKMNPDTDKAVAAWENLGVQAYDMQGNLRPLTDIFLELGQAMEGMTDQEKTQTISDMFKETDLAAVNALLGTSVERFSELSTAIEGADGAAKAMADTQLDNLAGDVTLFKSALEGAQIAISDQLTPTLRTFVQFGSDGLSQLTQAFLTDGLGGALDKLSEIIDQGVGLLFDVLPTVVDAGIALLEGLVSGILKNLPKLVDAAVKIITTLVKDLADNVDKVIDAAVEIIFTLADGLIEALPELIPAVVEIVLKIAEKLTDPDNTMKLIQASFQIIGAIAEGLIKALPQLIENVPIIIMNLVETFAAEGPQLVASGLQLITEFGIGLLDGIVGIVGSAREIGLAIRDAFWEIIDAARSWGKDLISNFTNGIKDRWNNLTDTLSHTAQSVKNFLGFSEPEEGPLSNFHTYAPDMMDLFAKGIRDNEGMLKDTVADAFDFGSMTVSSANQAPKRSANGIREEPITIIVQSVLDGKVIGETATKWQRREARALG